MKDVYLSGLEWTKTHDDMGGVMGNLVFKDNVAYEDYEKLLKSGYFVLCDNDYITNLQQENERLKETIDKSLDMLIVVYGGNDEYYVKTIKRARNILRNGGRT